MPVIALLAVRFVCARALPVGYGGQNHSGLPYLLAACAGSAGVVKCFADAARTEGSRTEVVTDRTSGYSIAASSRHRSNPATGPSSIGFRRVSARPAAVVVIDDCSPTLGECYRLGERYAFGVYLTFRSEAIVQH